ncbi:MAG: FG-GAP repeat protein, partial [Myxococcales bacterium]|nr:FG-GAP repeat protein [Myxococcales bacterium]
MTTTRIASLAATAALLLTGATGARAQSALIFAAEGAAPGDGFGGAISGAGDVDRDGTPDVIIGARLFDGPAGADSGQAVVRSGRTGAVLRTLNGENAGDRFGAAVSGAGDVNGDGTPDLLVGAVGWDSPSATDVGKVYVYSGATGALIRSIEGEAAFDVLGRGLDTLGDVNGDG